jgi:hypothetical protein
MMTDTHDQEAAGEVQAPNVVARWLFALVFDHDQALVSREEGTS